MTKLNEIQRSVSEIAQKYNLKSVFLFGSYARGDATEGSDLDFRVDGGNIRTMFDVSALRLDLEEALGHPVDLVLTKNMRNSFYQSIKGEEVLLYGDA